MEKITLDNFSRAILSEIENYCDETIDTVNKVIDEVANETYDDLRTNPKVPKRGGDYAKSFKIKVRKDGKSKVVTLSNTFYRLTHLLEKSHDIKRGGKKIGRTRAYPQWKHAEEIANTLPDRIKEALK